MGDYEQLSMGSTGRRLCLQYHKMWEELAVDEPKKGTNVLSVFAKKRRFQKLSTV